MESRSQIKRQLPARYSALADTPLVMGEVLDTLADLGNATRAVEGALVDAGLPKRAWRSEQAVLRVLSPALPAITMDAFLTRLELFALGDGPRWLQGTYDDLAQFHQGVAILANAARLLRDVVDRLQHLPVDLPAGARGDVALQGVVRHRPLQAPLDTIAEILSDLEALAPFMRPLTPEQWRAVRRARRGPWARIQRIIAAWASSVQIPRRHEGPSSSEPAAENGLGAANARAILGMGGASALQRLSALRRGRTQTWLAVVGLVVLVVGGLALFVFARQPHTTSQTPSLSSSAVLTALAEAGTAAASATEVATLSPTLRATLAPTPKLALTCVTHGTTATLTIKNVSAVPLSWQAQPPPTLDVSPAQGALQAGQSANVQVSAVNKKTVSGTITVVATHDTLSTQDKVSCR
jgi:hypothetical protein